MELTVGQAARQTGWSALSGFAGLFRADHFTINPQPLMITTATLPSGVSGSAYSTQVQTSGGFGTITLALSTGSLPTGLSIGPK